MHPRITVVIPTRNRAPLLERSLKSLARQTLPAREFEVVVVDDGSETNEAETLCNTLTLEVELEYIRLPPSGNAAAKNAGVDAAHADIVLFFDDDDIAADDLLEKHIAFHLRHPAREVAVLGLTQWSSDLRITPVMHFVTDIAQLLFAYKGLHHGQRLDFTYFWAGRSSCKKEMLTSFGRFDARFPSIIEDVELGFRLATAGLTVVFDRNARSYMARPVTFEDFCGRSERQGRALAVFDSLHDSPLVRRYCTVRSAAAGWQCDSSSCVSLWKTLGRSLDEKIASAQELEARVEARFAAYPELFRKPAWRLDPALRKLARLYEETFAAFRVKGMAETVEEALAATR